MSLQKVLRLIPLIAAGQLVALFFKGCDARQPPLQPKTLIIGMDGVQLQHYEQLGSDTHLQKRLFYGKAYAGGINGRASEQATISGPGWMTLLTGVWANKHGVVSNNESLRVDPEFPSLFKRLRDALPNAYLSSVGNWSPINTAFLLEDAQGNNVRESGLSDEQVTARTLDILDNTPADFTFIQLDEPDEAGHASGFGPAYQFALREADDKLGRLLDKVEERAYKHPQEDWLVIVCTDHGRDYWGSGHGGITEQEKTVFIASNKPLNEELHQPSIPYDNPGPNNLYGYAAQTSVAPTVLRHMGLDVLPEWKLDGTPLLGATGVRKARAIEGDAKLLWNSDSQGTVIIHRNGQVVANVQAYLQQWTDPEGMRQVNDYVLQLDDTPVAVRTRPLSEPDSSD
ncbi:alkaline phosphatase family protein [Pseudomonas sp. RW4S2]|uniref:Alkaline phosphatase family protein n=1 Tax=Pseudomonas vlassakiae TaxID=485888 RepID=A0A923GNK4_9PSED|nr:alkaline phosphatase family protein [Pseudomonas vlassakiae]MBV4542501.1 alkaline phosphatase family protein [Pseudomonas vlassakiae]